MAFVLAFWLGFMIASVLSLVCFLINQFMLLYDFNNRILGLRRGIYKWDDDPKIVQLSKAAFFVGGHVSYSIIGLMLTLIILSAVMVPLCFKYTWILVWELKWWIIRYQLHNID
jgi:hypothetical protein